MDARAIQNDRDRIGPTKKLRAIKRASSAEDDQLSLASLSPQHKLSDEKIVEYLTSAEKMCNLLRTRTLEQPVSASQFSLVSITNHSSEECEGSFAKPKFTSTGKQHADGYVHCFSGVVSSFNGRYTEVEYSGVDPLY